MKKELILCVSIYWGLCYNIGIMTDWAQLLNPEQLAAVSAPMGPVLVLAAAGTGKTRTLTHRVAWLVEQGESPEGILLLTFTNRAAREMMERAQTLVGARAGSLWSGTFHHVCHRILRQHAPAIGFTRSFAILDREDALSLLKKCMKAVELPKDFPKKEVIASFISKAQNTQRSLSDVLAETDLGHSEAQLVLEIAGRYAQLKQDQNAFDFDDLLVFTLKLLREHPDILQQYAERFRHVLVDEFQDTNTIQSQLVDLLASHHQNLMAVGDDFQCIYSWRGANFRNIMDFPKRWPGCQIIKLERNYRSVPEVLTLANACIEGNPEQFEKRLLPTRKGGRQPLVAYLHDAQEQAQMVLRHIQRALQSGYRPQDIAILYRSHFHVMEVELALRRQRMNYELTSGQGIFESVHAKDVIAYLKLVSDHADWVSFMRVMGLLPGVGEKTADRLWVKMGYQFKASDLQDRVKLMSLMPAKAKADWTIINETLEAFWQDDLTTNGNRAITRFLEVWYAGYLKRSFDNGEDRASDVAALAALMEKGREIGDFLAEAALMTSIDAETTTNRGDIPPGIRLSTVHQAKGLEWPVVILLWCNEEMFPSAKALSEGDDTEERRLFYVALTRAKDELLLCVPSSRRLPGNGNTLYLRPSRFIKELPAENIIKRYGIY